MPTDTISGDPANKQADLLCFSHLRWHFVTQRPQHLMRRASRDRRVFFWEEPVWHMPGELPLDPDGQLGMYLEIIEEAPSIWITRPHITWGIDFETGQRALLAKLIEQFSIKRLSRWFYTPMALGFAHDLTAEVTVYDCMDELANFAGAPPDLMERERRLFDNVDVVFTGGLSLYEKKKQQHGNVHAFPSSIDVEHFAAAKSGALAPPEDQAVIPHPRAGFYGVVDERFDVNLLAEVALLRPEVHFVILGPVVKIDPATLPQRQNIHYLGGKSYDELPAYLAGWDIALLPFARNDATQYISPTKTPEYLAAGKPVVSTAIQDVVRDYGETGLVAIAETAEDFTAALDSALIPRSENWHREVTQKLASSSWDSTWEAMQVEMDRVRKNKRGVEASSHGEESLLRVSHSVAPHLATLRIEPLSKTVPYNIPSERTSRSRRTERFDYLVVGAGFAGSVLAERLASQLGKRVLLVDKREHIGGNAYDYYNSDGILVHKYGPHIFHTNSDDVVAYLSQFTSWRPYEHRVLASVDGQLLPVPINLDTINGLYGLNLNAEEMKIFLAARCVVPTEIRTSEDIVLSRVGRELYEKFFRNYTRKQWGLDPSELDASVAGRIPVRFDQDDRYFTDNFQAMPIDGYTRMFECMLDNPLIHIKTNTDYRDVAQVYSQAKVIYTGPIDEYFDFAFGPLPYRSLEFRHETIDCEVYQSAPVVNYPNEHSYTRITEFKYLTGQSHPKTSIVYEYARAEGDPYYPIPRPENAALYAKYRDLAKGDTSVYFCGRLASYRYFNMDQVVAQALATFRNMTGKMHVSQPVRAIEAASIARQRRRVPLPSLSSFCSTT
jgi:UDP-galactopyranose mutase